jgi:cyclopropane-fatty-acyl-phospholipid synthase
MAQRAEIQALGYDDAFIRLWAFYFCYCEGGFLERTIGVVQVTAVKPNNIDTLHFSDLPSAVLKNETVSNDETAFHDADMADTATV